MDIIDLENLPKDLSPLNVNGLIAKFVWGWQRCLDCKKMYPYSYYQEEDICFHCRIFRPCSTSNQHPKGFKTWCSIRRSKWWICVTIHFDLRYAGPAYLTHMEYMDKNLWVDHMDAEVKSLFVRSKVPARFAITYLRDFKNLSSILPVGNMRLRRNGVSFEFSCT